MSMDILSHSGRYKTIYIFTLDKILADDLYDRIHQDPQTRRYSIVKPHITGISETVAEIEKMAKDTVSSKLLIIDVRKDTLPLLQKSYNKIVGYNRRDLNRTVFNILIGDGPANLLEKSSLDTFVPYLSALRVDYTPAAFFFDPLLHYELDEHPYRQMQDQFSIPNNLPKRLIPYFKGTGEVTVESVRKYFRGSEAPEKKAERQQVLIKLFKKRMSKQFATEDRLRLDTWLTKEGIQIASERLNLYPLYFEEWIKEFIEKPQPK